MLGVAATLVDWFAGAEILAALLFLNWFFHPGESLIVLACLATVGFFSAFAGKTSSALFGLAATLCFSALLLWPLDDPKPINARIVLTVIAFLMSSLVLALLVQELRKLNKERRSTNVGPRMWISPMSGEQQRGPTEGLRWHHEKPSHDIRAFVIEEMRLSTLEELSASIAHEMAQPLTAILLNGNACLRWLHQDNPPRNEIQDCIERITREGCWESDTIKRIHERCQRSPPQLTPTAMNKVIREIAPFIKREMAVFGAKLELCLSPSMPDALADSARLQQVFVSLTRNALQAMSAIRDRPPRIVISTWSTETGAVAFSVSDNGPGIAPENLSEIFEPFVTTTEGALGLGLSICRSVVEAHSGTISVINGRDHGANFVVTLPPA
jgi:C4-dicarboxylate-specific signal transduction histidine kinase